MSLEHCRSKIDEIDVQIIALLNERTRYVLEIGKEKLEKGSDIYAPNREYEVYSKIAQLSKGPLPENALKIIYREIMSAALALEKELKVGYLGPEASFTHLAALSKFGSSIRYEPLTSITDVFWAVEKKKLDYGVVPIENSTEGAVNHTLDRFVDSETKICAEILYEIHHNLLSNSKKKDIRRIYSNPQVFGQCRLWLESNLPKVPLIDTASTTEAAKIAAKEEGSAALASKLAASIYNLNILAESVEDRAQNTTRFLVIGGSIPDATGHDKTSIVVSIKDEIGALYNLLKPIHENRINMTKIESRPSKRKAWDYFFFIDLEGHIQDPVIAKALKQIDGEVKFLKVLGSYPMPVS